ncbi:MAG: hypothetical protein MUE56_07105 [Ignavibacteria bacterium]|jgi:hypothetical protein|nr:hypothetical protein [Ignavibacteria bacterium]
MIPNIFHFCYGFADDFGGKPFSLVHYLAIKSAIAVNNPDKVFFYYKYEPEGEWWDKARILVEKVRIEPPDNIFGNKLYHVAHKADIVRLNVLIEHGGIYLDLDTITKKSYESLRKFNFVIGKQGRWRNMGLCNAVMMAEKNAEFARLWLSNYKTFRSKGKDKYWAEHSVKLPSVLAKQNPDLLHIEPYNSFHFPLYYKFSLRKLFIDANDYPEAFCHHLWEGGSWDEYLSKLSVEDIMQRDSTYNLIARKYI